MGKSYSHHELIVWRRAQELAHRIIQLMPRLPGTWANAVLARQIVAAATSVGANIAEGHGRFTPGAHGNHLSIAKGSAAETDSWLDLLRREGYLTAEEDAVLHDERMQITAMLKSKILDLEALERSQSRKVRENREAYVSSNTPDAPPPPFGPDDYE